MKIPTDLVPGDRLWYSKTEYVTVRDRTFDTSPYYTDGDIRAVTPDGRVMFYDVDGVETFKDSPPIIRIERIASAKPKREKADRAITLPRSTVRAIRRWDAARKGGETQMSQAVAIVSAIARRLSKGGVSWRGGVGCDVVGCELSNGEKP